MHITASGPHLSRFLLELKPDATGFDDIQAMSARSRDACGELSTAIAPIRLLRSVFVPEDGSCFMLFEATSAPAVTEAARLAAVPHAVLWELRRAYEVRRDVTQ
jgi:hypothetical protein